MTTQPKYPDWEAARTNGIVVLMGPTRHNEAAPSGTEYLWEMVPAEVDNIRKLLKILLHNTGALAVVG